VEGRVRGSPEAGSSHLATGRSLDLIETTIGIVS
jgi:hypothetical protein